MAEALRRSEGEPIRWLCELKKASPSAGPIRPDIDVTDMAKTLVKAGASALSVLTEPHDFQGEPEFLSIVRGAVPCPILQKDFMVDEFQVIEGRALGADAVLLIVAALDPAQLRDLSDAARDLGMARLVEIHEASEMDRALSLEPEMIGVNNRNLKELTVNLETSLQVLPLIPRSVVRLSESGIRDPEIVRRLEDLGTDAILIGEHLMRAEDPADALRVLAGRGESSGPEMP
jgi:indole-3-glycerol phosphate synthase